MSDSRLQFPQVAILVRDRSNANNYCWRVACEPCGAIIATDPQAITVRIEVEQDGYPNHDPLACEVCRMPIECLCAECLAKRERHAREWLDYQPIEIRIRRFGSVTR